MSENVERPRIGEKVKSIVKKIITPPPNSADLKGAQKGPLDRCRRGNTWPEGCFDCGKLDTECDGRGYPIERK